MTEIQKKFENFFTSLGMIIFCGFVFVFILEIFFRTFYSLSPTVNAQQVNDSVHVPRPYVMAVASPKLPYVNSLGYKGDLPAMPKPKGEIRIAVMGGSNVYGDNQSAKGSIPYKLEVQLQKQFGKNIRVYNFGIPGSIARQNLNRLVLDVLPTEPDLVISYSGGNDLTSLDKRAGYPHRFIFYEVNPLWTVDIESYPLPQMIAFGSMAARRFYQSELEEFFLSKSRKNGFPVEELAWTKEPVLNYSESLIAMNKISLAMSSQYIAFFQPMRDNYFGNEGDKKYSQEWLSQTKSYLQEKSPNLKFVSLYNLYENQPVDVWRDHSHLYEENENLLISEMVAQLKSHFSTLLTSRSSQ